jgi:putative transposase
MEAFMTVVRNRHSREVKLRVVVEALKGEKTLSQLSSEHGVHPTQIKEWKEQGLEAMVSRFSQHRGRKKREEAPESRLFEEIGRLKVELDFLKGKLGS